MDAERKKTFKKGDEPGSGTLQKTSKEQSFTNADGISEQEF